MAIRALFLVNGLGLGNSTRCHAIIERLHSRRVVVDVITAANGLWYFEGRSEIDSLNEMEALTYGQRGGRLSVIKTLSNLGDYRSIMRRNRRVLERVLNSINPDVVVTDSVYTWGPIRKARIPIIAINNADVVRRQFKSFSGKPASIYPQFYGIELMDYFFHKVGPDAVISPTIDQRIEEFGKPFIRVGPIVRNGYKPCEYRGQTGKVAIMLSGSVFRSPVHLTRTDHDVRIEIVGRPAPQKWGENKNVVYHGRLRDTLGVLSDADLVIVNGGFSAINELFCMRKPMLVVPVPNHAEQWLNAHTVKKLGIGDLISEDAIESSISPAMERICEFRKAYERLPETPDGAEQAADLILSSVRKSNN